MASNNKESNALNSEGENGVFRVSITDELFNFKTVEIADQKVTGSQIAELAGAHPVYEYVILQHLKNGELESLRPDELTDLGEKGIERFFVIKGSETFRFTVEGLSMEWPRKAISGQHVKDLARVDLDVVLVLDQSDGDRVIGNDDEVALSADGVEQFRIRKKPKGIIVIYNHEHQFELEPRKYTLEELLKIFGVPAGYILDLVTDKGELRELKSGENILIVECMEFVSHPPKGQSS